MRLRAGCLASGQCSMSDRFVAFSMMLLKSGEHTWGKDVKTYSMIQQTGQMLSFMQL